MSPADIALADLLAFEAAGPAHPTMRSRAIRARFGISPLLYYRELYRRIQDPQALLADPIRVSQLRSWATKRRQLRVVGHQRDWSPA